MPIVSEHATSSEQRSMTPATSTRPMAGGARRRAKGEDGAALVEFALIMPFLFLLIFGIIEFGIAFNDYQSIRQGAREGARQAVVADYATASTSCGLNGGATAATDNVKKLMCLTKARTGIGNDLRVRIVVVENPPTGFKNDEIKVCTVRNVKSITGIMKPFTENKPLRTQVSMRAEKAIGIASGTYNEVDPSGDWTWCTT